MTESAAALVERHDCPTCEAPAGSPCRGRSGNVAHRYHTARLLLVPALRTEAELPVPADRHPGHPWHAVPLAGPAAPVRIGYACGPDPRDQLDALADAGCRRVLSDRVGASVRVRPGFDEALRLAAAAVRPDRTAILTVHRLDRLARTVAELVSVSGALGEAGVRLEVLTGPLAGTHDPGGAFFTVMSACAGLDRDHLREVTMEGQRAAAARGRRGGRPRVVDDDMRAAARQLRDQGVPVPEIAERLTIATGRNAGRHPSLATVYRALAEPDPTPEPKDVRAR